jgi:hypothetical protein
VDGKIPRGGPVETLAREIKNSRQNELSFAATGKSHPEAGIGGGKPVPTEQAR